MAPRLIELEPDMVDFSQDALKLTTLGLTAWVINSYILNRPSPIQDTVQAALITVAGLALHHLVTDKMIVRFVVKSGKEGYYQAMRRYN
jgi:hypothetical protein